MKSRIVNAIAVLFVALTLTVSSSAQTSEPGIHHANIPFAFHVENRSFPAGAYEVSWVGPRLLIKSLNGNQQALVIVVRVDASESSRRNYLRFNTYGGDYFLAGVWIAGQNFGHELVKSKLEMEVAGRKTPSSYAMVGLNAKR